MNEQPCETVAARDGAGRERLIVDRHVDQAAVLPQPLPNPEKPSILRFIFFGPEGLRPGWGLLLFFLIIAGLSHATNVAVHRLRHRPVLSAEQQKAESAKPQEPTRMLLAEGISFLVVAATSWIMSRIERRPVGVYGFGGRRKVPHFLAGFAWGLAFLTILVGTLWKARLLVFDGRQLFGGSVLKYAAVWLAGFILVGLLEEYLLRGYLQYTLSRGAASLYRMLFETTRGKALGFWTAAAFLSFVFGFGHGSNEGESSIGLVSAGLIGLIFCLSLWRTGSLWWALGFHASWDWAQSFLFGVADSGTMVQGHLLASHPVGRVLLSGGATGPEGSVFVLPVLAVVAIVALMLKKGPEAALDRTLVSASPLQGAEWISRAARGPRQYLASRRSVDSTNKTHAVGVPQRPQSFGDRR